MATSQHSRTPGAVEHPTRPRLHTIPTFEHNLDPPPIPLTNPFRQPGHAPHHLGPRPHRRLTQQPVEPRAQHMKPRCAPREVVPAAFTAPERRVPPVRLKSPRLDHPQQPCRGQHLARARQQRLGKRWCGRSGLRTSGTPRSPRTTPARLMGLPHRATPTTTSSPHRANSPAAADPAGLPPRMRTSGSLVTVTGRRESGLSEAATYLTFCAPAGLEGVRGA